MRYTPKSAKNVNLKPIVLAVPIMPKANSFSGTNHANHANYASEDNNANDNGLR